MISTPRWINPPQQWSEQDGVLRAVTDDTTDFWSNTWYGFNRFSGHVYGWDVAEAFNLQVRVRSDFTTLYDQAGIMVTADKSHWLKAGIEFNDGQPMIGSVLTDENSDWATGIFSGDPRDFWMRVTLTEGCLRVQYSTDGRVWPLLRLCPFPQAKSLHVGVMCCTPQRAGLAVEFSEISLGKALKKELHDLS
jgi:regulation of enolase protein 1 (concanavalin A-like superfamily)